MWTANFWQDTAERAIRTAAQAAVGILTAEQIGLFEVDWYQVASVSGIAALVAVLMAIGSEPVGKRGTASVSRR